MTDINVRPQTTPEGFGAISLLGLLWLLPAWLVVLTLGPAPPCPALPALFSAVSHTLYNLLSLTVILALFNPLQHAVLNTGKRASIVLAFYLVAGRPASPTNLISAVICLAASVVGCGGLRGGHEEKTGNEVEGEGKGRGRATLLLLLLPLAATLVSLPARPALQAGARQDWLQCIQDIQQHTLDRVRAHLGPDPASLSTPLLLVDPAYGGNVGDNLIAYGELVLMERLGVNNHTECTASDQSQGSGRICGNFSWVEQGGLAWWTGGGNWGDLWGGDWTGAGRGHRGWLWGRLESFLQLAGRDRRVLGMPQSLHYKDEDKMRSEAAEWMENLAARLSLEQSTDQATHL